MRIDPEQRRRRLAIRHHLADPSESVSSASPASPVAELADALVALHSSDPASVFLSVAVRAHDTAIGDIEDELYESRTVVRHHAMRRTLWVMTPAVAAAAHAACTRKIAAAERQRTAKLFGRDEDWVADMIDRVADAVADRSDPVSTREIGDALPDLTEAVTVNAGRSYEGTIAPHTRALLHAAFEGRIVRTRPAGTWIGSQYAWTVPERWLAIDWDGSDVAAGHRELVGRWLHAFGPGTLDDIVWWTGSTKTAVRRALHELEAVEVELDDGTGFLAADDVEPSDLDEPPPWVALLPGLDPTAMGWKQRSWYLDQGVARRVVDRNGNIGPTVWVDGRIVGGWVQRPDGTIAHDAEVPRSHRTLLDAAITRITDFVGDTRFRVRFPSPNQQDLLT